MDVAVYYFSLGDRLSFLLIVRQEKLRYHH